MPMSQRPRERYLVRCMKYRSENVDMTAFESPQGSSSPDPQGDRRRDEHVVWLLGAGFSKPLGGPLFSELLSKSVGRWVRAWLASREGPEINIDVCGLYLRGEDERLWTNAEECLDLMDLARSDQAVRLAVSEALNGLDEDDAKQTFAALTHFVAIATSHFLERATGQQSLPESWAPFEQWANTMTDQDSVITFNYDRVVETLLQRTGKKPRRFVKLHGTVPEMDELCDHMRENKPISTIAVPGPGKQRHAQDPQFEEEWKKAAQALNEARRLVVVGYSFPASDAFVLSFVLRHCKAGFVDIVVGPDPAGVGIAGMFSRFLREEAVRNTKLTVQQYFAEGTARLLHERFNHWRSW